MVHVPRNWLDKYGQSIQQVTRDINRDTLYAALQHVSEHIAARWKHVTITAVGGAVNILHLRSRATTHDVGSVFGSDFNKLARLLIDEATHSAR
ncbi:hypothetical protein SEUCBS140593_001764 [Sporothrix eucalyptigena]|uniref:Uncharacterized protein n=1 Tax=Sporothrix eucalyptigena TaxID=1812306 RepID=A0ABP0B0Z9_9PEZI